MKRLSKPQTVRHEELTVKLTATRDDLNAAIVNFNAEVEALHEHLAPKVADVNAIIVEVNEFVEEIHSEQENYSNDRTESWHDGDTGSAYADWMATWELEIDDLKLEKPTPFDEVEIDVDEFENLEQEVPS